MVIARDWNATIAVGTWAVALVTLLAASAAGVAAVITWRSVRRDHARLEAEQASKVAAWMAFRRFQRFEGRHTEIRWMTEIRNQSELPVYDWWLEYRVNVDGDVYTYATQNNFIHSTNLPPRDPMPEQAIPKRMAPHLPAPESKNWRVTVSIDFRDAAGAHWSRGHDGTLKRITAPREQERMVTYLNGTLLADPAPPEGPEVTR